MRKLATVRTISDIKPIKGADFIELAIVGGWQCVIGKGTFSIGEMVIYCEIDTVLPVQRQYEHLRKSCYVQKEWLPSGEGFRLCTMKMKGQVSQGLLLPLKAAESTSASRSVNHGSSLREYISGDRRSWDWNEGDDVSNILGIIKWNPPLPKELEGKAKGRYPSYIPKTYQERVQNLMDGVFNEYDSCRQWEITLKLDGESCTFYHNNNEVGVCSRTVDFILEQEGNTMVRMFHSMGMGEKLRKYGRNIAIQGELMGPGVHGNREELDRHQFYVFDVWDIDSQQYLSKEERDSIINALGLILVPVIEHNTNLEDQDCSSLEGMLKYADRPSIKHPVAEGVVFKAVSMPNRAGNVSSFKCINNRYLLSASAMVHS